MYCLIIKHMKDILLDARYELKQSFMNQFSWNNHGNQNLMSEPHQLLQNIDIRMHNNILEKNNIIVGIFFNILSELRNLNNCIFAMRIGSLGDKMIFPKIPFFVEAIFNILLLNKQSL